MGSIKLSKTERKFMQTLMKEATMGQVVGETTNKWEIDSADSDLALSSFEGSEDSLRGYFKTYFHSFAC